MAARRITTAIGRHVVGVARLHEQRHVAEHVVEDIGLLDVIELLRLSDPVAGGKTARREMREKRFTSL